MDRTLLSISSKKASAEVANITSLSLQVGQWVCKHMKLFTLHHRLNESVEERESTVLFCESLISMCFNILVTYFINSI